MCSRRDHSPSAVVDGKAELARNWNPKGAKRAIEIGSPFEAGLQEASGIREQNRYHAFFGVDIFRRLKQSGRVETRDAPS